MLKIGGVPMKELILNEDKLKDKEIDDYVTRVKAIIVNDKKRTSFRFFIQ